jgi:ribosomal protein S18 acetylase RimI-like enzyme
MNLGVGIVVTQASMADAEEILDLQKLAYQSEAAIYQDYSIPPLMQTLTGIIAELLSQYFLKAVAKEHIQGSVRAYLEQGTCYIGRLIVHPTCQNQGLGTKLMREIEGCFPDAKRFELFTGHLSERNLYLYKKLGYRPIRREQVSEKLTMVFMEKLAENCISRGLFA